MATMAKDDSDGLDVVPDATPAPVWLQRIVLLLPLIGFVVILGYNIYFWYRFAKYEIYFDNMDSGQCTLNSTDYSTSVLKLKEYWYYPVLGTVGWPKSAWSKIPCYAHVSALDSQGSEIISASEKTLLILTYWQGWVPNLITDTCHNEIPKLAEKGQFPCTFDFSQEYTTAIYAGQKEELPDYPLLFGMKATGLSMCTLAPFLLLACCCYKGHLDRAQSRFRLRTDFREACAREPLGVVPAGISSDCGNGAAYAPLLEGA